MTAYADGSPIDDPAEPCRARAQRSAGRQAARVPPIGLARPGPADPRPRSSSSTGARARAPARRRPRRRAGGWRDVARARLRLCTQTGAALELAHLPGARATSSRRYVSALGGRATSHACSSHPKARRRSRPRRRRRRSSSRTRARRPRVSTGVPFAGGTDMYFCELNRTRPQVDAIDGVFWSLNAPGARVRRPLAARDTGGAGRAGTRRAGVRRAASRSSSAR